MNEAQKMLERHRKEKTALYVKVFNQAGSLRKAARVLGISAATLCKYFADNGLKLEHQVRVKPKPNGTGTKPDKEEKP